MKMRWKQSAAARRMVLILALLKPISWTFTFHYFLSCHENAPIAIINSFPKGFKICIEKKTLLGWAKLAHIRTHVLIIYFNIGSTIIVLRLIFYVYSICIPLTCTLMAHTYVQIFTFLWCVWYKNSPSVRESRFSHNPEFVCILRFKL